MIYGGHKNKVWNIIIGSDEFSVVVNSHHIPSCLAHWVAELAGNIKNDTEYIKYFIFDTLLKKHIILTGA